MREGEELWEEENFAGRKALGHCSNKVTGEDPSCFTFVQHDNRTTHRWLMPEALLLQGAAGRRHVPARIRIRIWLCEQRKQHPKQPWPLTAAVSTLPGLPKEWNWKRCCSHCPLKQLLSTSYHYSNREFTDAYRLYVYSKLFSGIREIT